MKYILCECGKRYREDNQIKHNQTNDHKKYVSEQNNNEVHIIVHDIDKKKLIEFIRNQERKRKDAIVNDSDTCDSSDSEEGDPTYQE